MFSINFNHETTEEQATFRDTLCKAMVGWAPFIDNRVLVGDPTPEEKANNEIITHFIVGDTGEEKSLEIPADSIDVDDILECIDDATDMSNDVEGVAKLEKDLLDLLADHFPKDED